MSPRQPHAHARTHQSAAPERLWSHLCLAMQTPAPSTSGLVHAATQPPLQPFQPKRLALGIMVVPTNAAYRAAARQTWLNEAIKHATSVFVAGDVPCAHAALDREVALHDDIVFVKSNDCKKWHSPAKVHAWYTYALKAYPDAIWIAKMEDDGLCAHTPPRPLPRATPRV